MGDMELQVFSDRLKELRTEKGLTQAEFVKDLGITASALSAYEKNLKNPSISVAKRIAEKYNLSIDWLCGLTDEKNCDKKYESYGDIISELFVLADYIDVNIYEAKIEGAYHEHPGIFFDDKFLETFLQEWADASYVRYSSAINKTITQTMYDTWKKSKLEELSNKKLKKKSKK